jgi:mutator protein MutT
MGAFDTPRDSSLQNPKLEIRNSKQTRNPNLECKTGKDALVTTTPIIDVAAGLIFRDGKLLITKRYDDAHLGGLWEFPGGKREPQETFEQCLVRELREELGIEVTVGGLVESVTHEYPGKTVHLKFFVCVWQKHEPQALGCSQCKWIKAEELKEHEFPEADGRLLERLQKEPALWRKKQPG